LTPAKFVEKKFLILIFPVAFFSFIRFHCLKLNFNDPFKFLDIFSIDFQRRLTLFREECKLMSEPVPQNILEKI